jgi:hypothetical protein
MRTPPPLSRQRLRSPWTCERLEHKHAVALGNAIDSSTAAAYSSALQSYVTFCGAHDFPIDPTPDTLSFFTVYMCHHIKPSSTDAYLSGICNQLEPFYPHARLNCRHQLVVRTLRGCKKLRAIATVRKRPLYRAELSALRDQYLSSDSHDDLLFFVILLVDFHALMQLGEFVWPDKKALQDYQKVMKCSSVELLPEGFSFFLPGHKADRFFEGNRIIVPRCASGDDPDEPFRKYLASRDKLFPFHPELWLCADGSIPTCGWFIRCLRQHFPSNVAGHSLRAGGATALAQAGIPPHIIPAIGHWASDTFQIYIHQHPVLLAAFLFGRRDTSLS